jgi:hypothetical protein
MKSQVIGICGDAVPRAVQKDALTSRRHTAGGEYMYLAVPIDRTQERLAPCLDSDRGDGPEALAPQGTTVNPGVVCPAVAYTSRAPPITAWRSGWRAPCFTTANTPPPRRSLASVMRSASSATFSLSRRLCAPHGG